MSPAQNKNPQSPKSTSASESSVDTHSPSEPPSADPIVEPAMDQSSQPIAPQEEPLRPPTPPKRPVAREVALSTPQPSSAPAASELKEQPKADQPEAELTASESSEAEAESTADVSLDNLLSNRLQPIPPASEPMQYRAIGLVRGTYVPSEEQFTRGLIQTDDGVGIDAVLLGRVMSLVKKHLDLEQPHLWVVYPRTREKMNDLHVQIVGVWEPEKLNRLEMEAGEEESAEGTEESTEETAEETSSSSSGSDSLLEMVPASELDDKFFSIRGGIIYQAPEEERLMVKIRRMSRPGDTQDKAFKVALKGTLEGKAIGYFWDLQVQRQENDLIVQQGTMIGLVPPQKRKDGSRKPQGRFRRPGGPGGSGGPGGPGGGRRPSGPPRKWNAGSREGGAPRPQFKSGDRPTPSPQPRSEVTKPIKRRPPEGAPPTSQE